MSEGYDRVRYKDLGRTGLRTSELGFGCARLGGIFRNQTHREALRMLGQALDAGITFYDTSDLYCQGESEALLGKAFAGRRDQVIIASKVGYCLPGQRKLAARVKPLLTPLARRIRLNRRALPSRLTGQLQQDFSAKHITHALEQSLRRLRTDSIDLYQLHSPPQEVLECGDFLVPLEQLKQQGKIRFYGVSCETSDDALICLRYPEISSLQLGLNLLDQSCLAEALPRGRAAGVAVIARECFAGGLLAKPLDDAFTHEQRDDVEAWSGLAEQQSRSLPELALQFPLGLDAVSVTLVGMRTSEHLREAVRLSASRRLSDSEARALMGASTRPASAG